MEKLADQPAYREIREIRRFTQPLREFRVDTGKGRQIAVKIFDISETFQARGYGADLTELLPMIVRRQMGKKACFVAVYQLLEQGAMPEQVSAELGTHIKVCWGNTGLEVGTGTTVVIGDTRQSVDIQE